MARGAARDPRSLDGAWARHQQLGADEPPRDLAPSIDRLWAVSWSYDASYRQLLPPHLDAHLTFPSDTEPTLTGPATKARDRVLEGSGHVVGVAFRPGVLRALLGRPVATITDTSLPAAEVLGADLPEAPDRDAVVALLRRVLPEPYPTGLWCARVVARVVAEPDLRRVDDLATAVGASVRQLQRRFAEHVGVTPKQVVRQVRLRGVMARLAAGSRVDWAGLALELGYADQAHLSRDLTALLGEPPTAYAARH